MTDPDLDLDLVDALAQTSFAVHAILGTLLARHDMSITQARMLGILRDREPGMLELAGFLGLEKSSTTGLVDRAARRGLVERAAAEHDGRAVHVRLTAAGRELARVVADELADELGGLLEAVPARDRAHLARSLSRLVFAHARREGIDLRAT